MRTCAVNKVGRTGDGAAVASGPTSCAARFTPLAALAISASLKAGAAILDVYRSDFAVEHKDDKSPLTLADRRSHEVIASALKETGLPILSEEGRDIPYEERRHWEYFWLVDPLDGTKEFIKRNGEFTVNIALIHKTRPVMGVVYVPVKDVLYFGGEGLGAYKQTNARKTSDVRREPFTEPVGLNAVIPACPESFCDTLLKSSRKLPLLKESDRPYTVIASRSHMSKETEEYLDKLRAEHGEVEIISAGSSLKFCLVAEGLADEYPRFGPTMEWDTAAGQAVVEGAGGDVVAVPHQYHLAYNKPDLHNPWFMVRLEAAR